MRCRRQSSLTPLCATRAELDSVINGLGTSEYKEPFRTSTGFQGMLQRHARHELLIPYGPPVPGASPPLFSGSYLRTEYLWPGVPCPPALLGARAQTPGSGGTANTGKVKSSGSCVSRRAPLVPHRGQPFGALCHETMSSLRRSPLSEMCPRESAGRVPAKPASPTSNVISVKGMSQACPPAMHYFTTLQFWKLELAC
ncbi:hypothetical protein NDU88_004049 [Pleurodeles waltl]|uniref:Uncharacterized protein n=1 Tax=Pleurodeles waltl TaxID=8319 RepID=A0AAV7TQE4_PLEWA|nr:hypothetical protein NDU88_004049 [Pleurodeles waltl]